MSERLPGREISGGRDSLGDHKGGESLGIGELVQSVVKHHHARAQAQGEDAELGCGSEKVSDRCSVCLCLCVCVSRIVR